MLRAFGRRAVLWAALLLCSGLAHAAELGAPAAGAPRAPVTKEFERPSAPTAHIDVSEAPIIDADFSDPAWAKATVIDKFRQRQPNPGDEPTERTVLRIMYDSNAIYFAVYAYDSQPDLVISRAMARDRDVFTGDNIGIILDPGLTRRNGYLFQIGPSGGRYDALRLNNAEELVQWDTIWEGRAKRVADGWVAELAIPFRSISYVEGQTDWGFEFVRGIRRKNENDRWSSTNLALPFQDISESGTLTGITGIDQGLGLDIQVYGVLRAKHDWHVAGDGAGISATAGGNAFYKITPALTGTLTVNPDFSDAPLDVREVNTTRFSLFVPETRDFFLQDAAAFEFGGRGFVRPNDRTANNARPFFSRNLGLVRGVPVSIFGGGKLSGEFADFDIGALSVVTDDTPTSPSQVLSVARISHPVLEQSRFGAIITHGDPTGATDNTVAGADFQYRISDFLGGDTLQSDLYYERSFSSADGEDDTFGVAVALPNEPWGGDAAFKQVGSDFRPALGFANRTGIRYYDGTVVNRIRFRDAFLRQRGIIMRHILVTDLANHLESRESRLSVEGETFENTNFSFDLKNFFEDVPAAFFLPGHILVPAGSYNWTTLGGFFQTTPARPFQVRVELACCGFYNGSGLVSRLQLNFRPSPFFDASVTYDMSRFDLPGGKTYVHVVALDGAVNFTPDMQIALQAQYDNISQAFGLLARYRWEFNPGSEFFVAFGQSAVIPGTTFRAQTTQLSIRLGHTLRF